MGVKVTFEIEGDKEVSMELGIEADKISKWTEPLEKIDTELLYSIDQNFSSSGALFDDAGAWVERKGDYPWPILEKTGNMRGNFHSQVFNDYLVIKNPTEYFKYHQSNKPRKALPRRVMMKIDSIRRTFIIKKFQEYIVETTRKLKKR